MAGRPIVVKWAADVKDYVIGARRVGAETDKVADELDRLAKGAERVEDSVGDAMRDVGRAAKDAARDTDRAGRSIESDMDDIGKEARQSSAEMLSSFDGSAEGLVGMFQEVAGQVSASLGNVAAAAGAAVAVGIGVLWSKWSETEQRIAESVASLRGQLVELGGAIDDAAWDQRIKDLFDQDPAGMSRLVELTRQLGLDANTAARAMAGDLGAYQALIAQLQAAARTGAPEARDAVFEMYDILGSAAKVGTQAAQQADALAAALSGATTPALALTEQLEDQRDRLAEQREELDRIARTQGKDSQAWRDKRAEVERTRDEIAELRGDLQALGPDLEPAVGATRRLVAAAAALAGQWDTNAQKLASLQRQWDGWTPEQKNVAIGITGAGGAPSNPFTPRPR